MIADLFEPPPTQTAFTKFRDLRLTFTITREMPLSVTILDCLHLQLQFAITVLHHIQKKNGKIKRGPPPTLQVEAEEKRKRKSVHIDLRDKNESKYKKERRKKR